MWTKIWCSQIGNPSEKTLSVYNIPSADWAIVSSRMDTGTGVSEGNRIIFDGIWYENLTGTLDTSTAPITDTINWRAVGFDEIMTDEDGNVMTSNGNVMYNFG